MKSKKGQGLMVGAVMLILIIVGVLAVTQMGLLDGFTTVTPGDDQVVGDQLITTACGDDNLGDIYIKLQDDSAATETFIASSTIYLKDMESGIIKTSVTSASGGWASINDTQCGRTYRLYSVAQAAAAGSAVSHDFVLDEESEYIRLHSNKISNMEIRVENLETDSVNADWGYLFADDGSATNSTGFVDLNTTNVKSAAAGTDIAVGADGHLSATIHVKAETNLYRADDEGKRNQGNTNEASRNIVCSDNDGNSITCRPFRHYVCIDTGTDAEWDEDTWTITFDGASKSSDARSLIDDDSQDYSVVRNIDRCALIGDIDSNNHQIYMYIGAKSGQNPDTSNDDLKVYFLSEGFYLSSDNGDLVNAGIYTNAATPTAVVYTLGAEDPILVFNIS